MEIEWHLVLRITIVIVGVSIIVWFNLPEKAETRKTKELSHDVITDPDYLLLHALLSYNEVLGKILAFNVMVNIHEQAELGIESVFWPDNQKCPGDGSSDAAARTVDGFRQ